ncbi:hypothetical protein [Nonomuraea sp. B19D2]|uniref:hypothetical protein n=1 Tax=Nonomuraea sp. B19D2 TaxID=3159561 RepID=UPI0032DAD57D
MIVTQTRHIKTAPATRSRTRAIVRAASLATGAVAMAGLFSLGAAPASAAALMASRPFDCGVVGGDRFYSCPESTINVRSGRKVSVAVAGSKGKRVKFRLMRSGEPVGKESPCIRVGDAAEPLWTNRTGRTVSVRLQADICDWFGTANVVGRLYY